MAGNYPDVPGTRMVYDRDGVQVYKIDSTNVVTQFTSSQIANLNDEDDDAPVSINGQNGNGRLFIFFPELRDLSGFYATMAGGQGTMTVEVSVDTTNGLDGQWLAIWGPGPVPVQTVRPNYRTGIVSVARNGIRGIRFSSVSGIGNGVAYSAIHLYGSISTNQNPNRLAIWDPAGDFAARGAYFDWGNTPRGSSADRTFRVKNMSSSRTANAINLSLDAATDTVPSVPGQYLLSADGTTFSGQITIGDLGPGGLSPVLTIRRVTPTDATLSVWAARLIAEASSWS